MVDRHVRLVPVVETVLGLAVVVAGLAVLGIGLLHVVAGSAAAAFALLGGLALIAGGLLTIPAGRRRAAGTVDYAVVGALFVAGLSATLAFPLVGIA